MEFREGYLSLTIVTSRQVADNGSIVTVYTTLPFSGLINTNVGGRGLEHSVLDIINSNTNS